MMHHRGGGEVMETDESWSTWANGGAPDWLLAEEKSNGGQVHLVMQYSLLKELLKTSYSQNVLTQMAES